MKRTAAAALLLIAGCASSGGDAAAPPRPQPAETGLVELQRSMTELLERLDVINERLSRLERAREESGASAASPAQASAPRQPVVTPVPVPAQQSVSNAPPASSALRSAEIAQRYRSAIMLYADKKIAQARSAFQQVFDDDPSSELADNALFWIGETYYSTGDYPNAISYYRRVSGEYPNENKAPDAVYKLGLAYARTGDLALARETFQEVITRYPYSTPAASARSELERIKY